MNDRTLSTITAGLSFLGGLLSCAAALETYRRSIRLRGWLYAFAMWRLAWRLNWAFNQNDEVLVEALEFQLAVLKLNSPDPAHQMAGMTQILHLGPEVAFELLAARLSRLPALPDQNKIMLLSQLRKLLAADGHMERQQD